MREQITTLSVLSVSTTHTSWRLLSHSYGAAHTRSLYLSLYTRYTHKIIMLALGVFIHIHSIGLFTNIALNGTLALMVDIALSKLRLIQLLSE